MSGIVCFSYRGGIVQLLCWGTGGFYSLFRLRIDILCGLVLAALILGRIRCCVYRCFIFTIFLVRTAMDLLMNLMIVLISYCFISTFGSSTFQIFLYCFLILSFICHF